MTGIAQGAGPNVVSGTEQGSLWVRTGALILDSRHPTEGIVYCRKQDRRAAGGRVVFVSAPACRVSGNGEEDRCG